MTDHDVARPHGFRYLFGDERGGKTNLETSRSVFLVKFQLFLPIYTPYC